MIFAAEKPRGPGISPWRVCVPIFARSKGVDERREVEVRPESSFAVYLTLSRTPRCSSEFRASSSVGGVLLAGSSRPKPSLFFISVPPPEEPPVGEEEPPSSGGTTTCSRFFVDLEFIQPIGILFSR